MKKTNVFFYILSILFAVVLAYPAQALIVGNIVTIAGGGVGDNADATVANLKYPSSVSVDATDNLYIADRDNNRIRKVNAATGIITTVAGNGMPGFSGDNGAATVASLRDPSGVSVDSAGNLYIADMGNNRIRKVSAVTGIITTIAGNGTWSFGGDNGAATTAGLCSPSGVSVDSAGNLYIADMGNNRIRKVNAATGIITTVAGNGMPTFNGDNGAATVASLRDPSGVSVDSAGNLYIADTGNNRIRKVNAANAIITTVAGNGVLGFNGDNGAATAALLNGSTGISMDSVGNLFIADSGNNRIRKVDAATGIITTVAGNGVFGFNGDNGAATAARLYGPTGISLDSTGNIYIADKSNYRIRKVDAATGIITTVAGNGTSVFIGDNGAATNANLKTPSDINVDNAGNLYIADSENYRIRKVNAMTGFITTVAGNGTYGFSGDNGAATSATLKSTSNVSVDNAGNLYIADSENHRIRKVDASTGIITTVAGNGTRGFNGDNGAATAANLYGPTGVSVDSAGNLYIADSENYRIRKVNAITGIITTVAGNGTYGFYGDNGAATTASLKTLSDVTLDSAGNLYIADMDNSRIRKVNATTGIITTVAGNGTWGFSGDNGPATAASLSGPTGISVDSTGNLYIADMGNNRIRKVNATTGIITTVAGNGTMSLSGDNGPATAASLNAPSGVSVDSAGQLYISDKGNNRIRKVYLNSMFTLNVTISGNGTVNSNPSGFSCGSSSCSKEYPDGTSLDLLATPSDTLFSGWSGNCSGDTCSITMNDNKSVTATFTTLPKVRIGGATPIYLTPPTLQNIYNNADNGAEIELKGGDLDVSDTLTANDISDKSVILKGGFDAGYTYNSGTTTIPGPFRVSRGIVRVERINVR